MATKNAKPDASRTRRVFERLRAGFSRGGKSATAANTVVDSEEVFPVMELASPLESHGTVNSTPMARTAEQLPVSSDSGRSQDIAIVGMSGVFPKAPDLKTFWANILGKVEAITEPVEDWGAERYFDPSDPERLYTKSGGYLRDLYRLNTAELGIMPNSVDGGEPDQFLALKVARDALIDAGYAGADCDHTNTGIVLGHSTYLHRGHGSMVQHGVVLDQTVALLGQLFPDATAEHLDQVRGVLKRKLPPFNADTAPGLVPNVMTGRIANRLDLHGPNYLIDAACASSTLAVQAAMEELRRGHSDLMLAGGVNASIPAEVLIVFTQLGALSKTSKVRPFDANANGTLLGEGLGVIALKRLSDAVADGDRIYAVMKGVGQSSDGKGRGLLAPSLDGETLAIQRAYNQSQVDPKTVSLIEAHGTGIPLGDRTEIEALTRVFGRREGDLPRCAIGSVKSMISHCIPAAGIAGIIKTALALHHKVLPPTICGELNPELGVDQSPLFVNTEPRPWVSAPNQPRRAGVDAFGFGGINTHAVLEEAPTPIVSAPVEDWPFELVVFQATGRDGLIEQGQKVLTFLDDIAAVKDAALTLRDIAIQQARSEREGAQCLAIVANDLQDLQQKLGKALQQLGDPERHRLQTRSGIYFTDTPIAGELAYLFPGEGSQYLGMLTELALHFPVVREWLDFWDGLHDAPGEVAPSMIINPPPTAVSKEALSRLEQQLNGVEIGSEAVFIACQASLALLESFGVEADAAVGHSSGENSALVASGLVKLGSREALADFIAGLKGMYAEMGGHDVSTGRMLAIGAVDRERILELVAASNGKLHLALDNCQHQTVIYGADEDIDKAASQLSSMGGLCSRLDIERPYHTPLFEAVAKGLGQFYANVTYDNPRWRVYSCVTADVFPTDELKIRKLAAMQWSARVRFNETIEQMHAAGVRHFVEVGPASNLTHFVGDILPGKDHVSAAVDNRSRPGLRPFLQVLGRLFVHGRLKTLGPLYAGRSATEIDYSVPPGRKRLREREIANTLPYVALGSDDIEAVSRLLGNPSSERGTPKVVLDIEAPAAQTVEFADAPQDALVTEPSLDEVMASHLNLMHGFLQQQERVLSAGLVLSPTVRSLPFVHRIVSQDDRQVVAECDLDREADGFLRDHILYTPDVSVIDPNLTGLAVVPLAGSLEMLLEVASLLSEKPPVALEAVTPKDWIAFDDAETLTVRLIGEVLGHENGDDRIRASIFVAEKPVVIGEVLCGDPRPSVLAPLTSLEPTKEPILKDDDLYRTGMFHGPLFQSIGSLKAWNEQGIDASLATTSTLGFFAENERPDFFINPILIDAIGQLGAFWIEQARQGGFSTFPSRIDRLELFHGAREETQNYTLRGRIGYSADGRFLTGDYDCLTPAGELVFRANGWSDRFIEVPRRFYHLRTHPQEGWLGDDWSARVPNADANTVLWFVPAFSAGFFEDIGAISRRLLAQTVLGREERLVWSELRHESRRAAEWLMGRVAIKEAARYWYWQHTGVMLYPADLIVGADVNGKPFLTGWGLESFGAPPQVSLAHAEGANIAVAGHPQQPVGVDLERIGRVDTVDLLRAGFSPSERGRVESLPTDVQDEQALKFWCAKEATAKSLGTGMNGNPQAFEVLELSPAGDRALVRNGEHQASVSLVGCGERVVALATAISRY